MTPNSFVLFVSLSDSKFTSVICIAIWLPIHLRCLSGYMTPNSPPLFVLLYDSKFTYVVCLVIWLPIHLRCLSGYMTPNSSPLFVLLNDAQFPSVIFFSCYMTLNSSHIRIYLTLQNLKIHPENGLFCWLLFVVLNFFFWPLYCLSFHVLVPITHLVGSSCILCK